MQNIIKNVYLDIQNVCIFACLNRQNYGVFISKIGVVNKKTL